VCLESNSHAAVVGIPDRAVFRAGRARNQELPTDGYFDLRRLVSNGLSRGKLMCHNAVSNAVV
jgi:hypothetical protein